jgi:hypothetical protein
MKARAKHIFVFPHLCLTICSTCYPQKTKLLDACFFCSQQLIEEKEKWETDQEKIKLGQSQEIEELKLDCEKRGKLIYQYCYLRYPQQQINV